MNIGFDFNTKTTKAAFLDDSSSIEDYKIIEAKNIIVFVKGDIYTGNEAFDKFLTEKESIIYDLDRIIELNGLVVNKKQISVEKCLSVIFAHLLEKIKIQSLNNKINFICVSIPYDKYYYWHDLIRKAFSLIGIEKLRIISQPAAFFGQPDIDHLHNRLNSERLSSKNNKKYIYDRALNAYSKLPWYKKLTSKQPKFSEEKKLTGYLFVSISQDNTNVSLIDYDQGVSYIISTQYTNSITRRKIEDSIFNYFLSEISKESKKFAVKDLRTLLRILEVVDEFLKTPHSGNAFELSLPYLLCEDGEYRNLDIRIDLDTLNNYLKPSFNDLADRIKQLAIETQNGQQEIREEFRHEIGDILVIGEPFIQQNIKEILYKNFNNKKVIVVNEKSLVIGAYNFSRIFTGEYKNHVALEVIPFSVLVRLRGGEFVELIKKDSTIPICSKEHFFTIAEKSKSKFVELQLTTKEGNIFQSLNVWKIKIEDLKEFSIAVNIGADLKITLEAYPHKQIDKNSIQILGGRKDLKDQLIVQGGSTFSFNGTGFDVGIKGKDIRQYILNQFNYLSDVLKNNDVKTFEPNEDFYSTLKNGDPFKALRYLGYYLKLNSLPDVELVDSDFFDEQGIAGFIKGKTISIPKYFTNDPYGFGYVLAHELAHYVLIHEEQIILDDEQENEILTEIYVIYCGMGKLFLNGFKSKDVKGSLLTSRGYLSEKILQYIHQIYISKFNVNLSDYKKNLTRESVKILEEFID